MEHLFTINIKKILSQAFGEDAEVVYDKSLLIQYINEKTRSANKGSKARSGFANLYALYVIIEDYVKRGYDNVGDYSNYEGAVFGELFMRQRELPFGGKLQNHALNNRMNSEFQKFFPNTEYIPILRNFETNRYWINEHLLKLSFKGKVYNIASVILQMIDEYIQTKQDSFRRFVQSCTDLQKMGKSSPEQVEKFIIDLLAPNVDARLFEIVSYAILKYYYHDQKIYWGFKLFHLKREALELYKTGRTNANDGGIDFVMRPLGRFFQVTETLDFKKYFLDIDKIQKYPISFVVKSMDDVPEITKKLRENAYKVYPIQCIIDKYMDCIEELINIPILINRFKEAMRQGYLNKILEEIIVQSRVEFNFEEDEED
ncbi:MAG: restriction endonuclease [Prevotellaceae bacterium]|jgi:hypothetical protein|nr:restriction endonuclease [Prevotellaceae bacterium]